MADTNSIRHFVLTRFNIASPGREAPIRNTPGWLGRRFELFETYCLPSMAAQNSRDFQWLIYFDEGTPPEFRERIERARRVVPFEPIFVGMFRAGAAAVHIAERMGNFQGRLLTTRLDNDDAVSRDFLHRTRAFAESCPDGTIINFRNGVALKNGRLYTAEDESNPFTSLIEPAAEAKTIWAAPHTELARLFPLRQVIEEPCWLQVVHGENVTNRIKGRRLADQDVLARFALGADVQLDVTGDLTLAIDRIAAYPARQLRETALKIAKKALRRH